MKKVLLICSLMMAGLHSWAQNPTTDDHLTVGNLQLNLGGSSDNLSIYLEGNTYYTAFGADIYLPDGYSFALNRRGNPSVTIDTSDNSEMLDATHTYGANIQNDGALRVTIYSSNSTEFWETSGLLLKLGISASGYAKPGAANIEIRKCFFVTSEGVKYVTADRIISDKVSASTVSTLTLNVSQSAQWSTCILPFAASIPEGVKAYTCEKNDDEFIYLSEAESFDAYTPYILYADKGYSGTISGTVDASGYPETGVVNGNYLNGAIVQQTAKSGYVLQKQSDDVKFYAIEDGDSFTIPAGKCWMTLPEGTKAKALGFKIDDANGINEVVNIPTSSLIFDISGRQLQSVGKGIFIKNGKKVIIR